MQSLDSFQKIYGILEGPFPGLGRVWKNRLINPFRIWKSYEILDGVWKNRLNPLEWKSCGILEALKGYYGKTDISLERKSCGILERSWKDKEKLTSHSSLEKLWNFREALKGYGITDLYFDMI